MDEEPRPTHTGIRASDAEREEAIAQLQRHAVDGRLTAEEFAERMEQAQQARTREQLRALLADLPPPETPRRESGQRRHGWGPPRVPALGLALLVALLCGVWALGGMTHGFFPLFPLLFWGFLLLRLTRRA